MTEVEATTDATFPVESAAPNGQLHSDLGVGIGPPGHSVARWLIGAAVLGTATLVGLRQHDIPRWFVAATGLLGVLALLLAFRNIRKRWLGIPADAVFDMQQTVDELAEVRRIQQGQLTPIDTDQKLQRQEVYYFEGPGRLLKSVILQSFRRDGVRYKMRELEIDKEGTLLITSKRVTLRHEGTSNIPHEKIIDLEVDLDRNLLTNDRQGRHPEAGLL